MTTKKLFLLFVFSVFGMIKTGRTSKFEFGLGATLVAYSFVRICIMKNTDGTNILQQKEIDQSNDEQIRTEGKAIQIIIHDGNQGDITIGSIEGRTSDIIIACIGIYLMTKNKIF